MNQRKVHRKAGAAALLTPRLKRAPVQAYVLSRNRQTQTGTTQSALTRSISTPETVEDLNSFILRQTDTMVAHSDTQVRCIRVNIHVNRPGFTMLNCVIQQIAQHTLNTHTAHIDHDALVISVHIQLRIRTLQVRQSLLQNIRQHLDKVLSVNRQHCTTSVETRNLKQVGQHRLETIHLTVQKLHASHLHRSHILTRIIQQLSTQTHRR